MARKTKDFSFLRRLMLGGLAVVMAAAACWGGFYFLQRYVSRTVTFPRTPPRVVLLNRPAWMSDRVAQELLSLAGPTAAHGVFDQQMLKDACDLLAANPWVKKVNQVRRGYDVGPGDVMEFDCEYRAPIALVHWKDYYWLVDGEGVLLPEQYTLDQLSQIMFGTTGQANIRVIEGVTRAPPAAGHHWPGDDLAAGLDLVKFLYGKSCTQEVRCVDIANFDGRVDPHEAQLVLWTAHKTQIRWGRPVNSKDFFAEISPTQKLERMEKLIAKYHRLDANLQWIDLRFDKTTGPVEETADGHN